MENKNHKYYKLKLLEETLLELQYKGICIPFLLNKKP